MPEWESETKIHRPRGARFPSDAGGAATLIESLESRLLLTAAIPRYDHVVIVVEENHSQADIIGSGAAPYINSLAWAGTSFTNFYSLNTPSQPNYFNLFAGSNQGVGDNNIPSSGGQLTSVSPYTSPNLAAELRRA